MDEPSIDDPDFWDWFFNNNPRRFPVPTDVDEGIVSENFPGDNSATHVLPIAIEPIDNFIFFNR